MTDTNLRDKLRAVFLAALMIGSVMGAGVAFTGSAAAASSAINPDLTESPGQLEVSVVNQSSGTIHATYRVNETSGTINATYADGTTVNSSYTNSAEAIDYAIGNTSVQNQTVLVGSGEYDGSITLDQSGVSVEASGSMPTINASDVKTAISIEADETTFDGFEIVGDEGTKDGIALRNQGTLTNVTVTNNVVRGMEQAYGPSNNNTIYGIHSWGSTTLDGVEVTNNDISNVGNTTYGDASPQAISLGPFAGAETVVDGNTISNLQSADGVEFGILLYDDDTKSNNVSLSGNDVTGALYDLYSSGGSPANLNSETTTDAKFTSVYESNTNFVNVTVDGVKRTDASGAPEVTNVTLLDSDEDGDIDTATVDVDENVSDASLDAGDFTLGGNAAENVTTANDAYDDVIQIELADDNEIDATGGADTMFALRNTGTVSDLAGKELQSVDQQNVTYEDSAKPVVEDVSFTPSVVNLGNNPTTVTVSVTFSEDVNSTPDGFGLNGTTVGTDVTFDNDTVTGTTDSELGTGFTDQFVNTTINGVNDTAGNDQVAFDQENFQVDTIAPKISTNTVTTVDSDNNGQVDQLVVDFNDAVDDSTVEKGDFTVSNPAATVDEVVTGESANDNTVILEVSGLSDNDTSVTPDVTLAQSSIEDTAGNAGPSAEQTQIAEDGASPIVTDVTLNETELNISDVPADVEVNVTLSEDVTTDPSVTLVGLSQGDITASSANGDDGDATLSTTTDTQIVDNNEDVAVYVNVSNGDDSSGNAVETWNQSDLTVDTLAPSVTVNGSAPEGDIVNGTLDLSTFFDISEDDGGKTTYLINTTATGSNYTEVSEQFDTNSIDDTAHLTVRAVDTDNVGNSNNATTGEINVDNTAPQVTIEQPSETTARPTGGVLDVTVDVTEQNIATENATLVLEGGNNSIQYNASLSAGTNDVDLLLNTSENASSDSARLPDLNASSENASFDTQTVYDLSVTVEDSTNKSTTATQTDALFLDDTAPANFSLVAPSDPTEYDLTSNDELVVSYGYTEDNTESVTVSLTNESGAVANVTVDESQYTDDGVIKSFELDLLDSFDTGSLADGRYNVSVTVTDLAGNELTDATENAPVAINADGPTFDGTLKFQDSTPTATASIGDNPENVTVEATYNVSVPDVSDAGAITQPENVLTNVDVVAPNATVDVRYYDASAGVYKDYSEEVVIDFSGENITANATVTESVTVDISDVGPTITDADRVLTRDASISGTVNFEAEDSYNTATGSDTLGANNKNFVNNDSVAPELDSIEVDGDVGGPTDDQLTLTFSRPVQPTDAGISADDFGYINENGNDNLYVTDVSGLNDPDGTQITVTLNGSVEASDVGSDIVSIQPDVLENTESSYKNVSATSATFQEGTAPAFTSAKVTDNASVVEVEFSEPVQAEDGSDLTAANLSYSGDANVADVTQSDSESATVTLDAAVTSSDLDSGVSISADGVYDRFGNKLTGSVAIDDVTGASDLVIDTPSSQVIKQSDSTLDVAYRYVENVPEGTADVDITLSEVNGGDSATFNIDDSQFVANATKSLTLDLSEKAPLTDGAYDLTITVTDAAGNPVSVTANSIVVVNDDAPDVSGVDVAPDQDVAPDETVDVTYNYDDATNATSVTVHVVAAEDVDEFEAGDFDNATFEMVSKDVDMGQNAQSVEVDLSSVGIVTDNSDYELFVTATDESGFTNLNTSATPIIEGTVSSDSLDVNAEQPTLDSVEADTGSDTVTVTFSEAIVAADGDLSADDFVYQDVTNSGAGTITDVARDGPASVELTLDSAVTSSDLGSDLVNVRSGAIEDTDGDNARQVSLSATALADTDAAIPSVDAGPINANNEDSYTVTVDTTSETTDVSVVLNGSNGTELSDSATSVTGEQRFTFNVSAFEDGPVDIDVELTDAGGNTASTSTTVEKDTVAPTIESATTNAGTDTVSVAFSESVEGLSAESFTISSPAHEVVSVNSAGDSATLTLNASVPAAAINNSSVAVVAAPGVADDAGNAVAGDQKLTDVEAPMVTSITADRGDENVTITFTENVNAGDDAAIDADDYTYTDTNDAGASGIESATQTGPQTVVVTLNDSLTPSDLAEDHIGVAADSVFDSVGHPVEAADYTIGIESDLSVSSADGTLTVTVVSPNNVSDAIGSELTIREEYRELESLEGFELDERFETTLSASDFDEVEAGVYEASVDVPVDAEYTEDGIYSVTGSVDSQYQSAATTVDSTAPYPTDAVLLGVTSEAQYDSSEQNTTRVRVLFNEPIDASNILPSDVSIEGFDGEVVAVQDSGVFGAVEVVVEGKIQTGTHPTVTIDGDSYADLAGTSGEADGKTVIHTDTLDLEKGQNYVSVPAASGDLPLDEIDTSAVDAIYAYDAESGSWEAYDPDAQENELTALEGGEGYIFVMDEDATIEVNVFNVAGADSGADPSAPAPTQQTLSEGWNLIGQYQEFDQQVDIALASLSDGSVYDVLAQDESADGVAFESYSAGDFQTMERGEGYWVFVQNDEAYTEASGHTAGA